MNEKYFLQKPVIFAFKMRKYVISFIDISYLVDLENKYINCWKNFRTSFKPFYCYHFVGFEGGKSLL